MTTRQTILDTIEDVLIFRHDIGAYTAHHMAATILEAMESAEMVPDSDPNKPTDWHDAGVEADYRWHLFTHAKTPLDQAQALTDLSNAMYDLRTHLPGYDYETGTLPWEREE